MYIRIRPDSETPIYTQLIYQIKKGILRKELLPGEGLPSVRSLAGDIGINMHTVNKAYKLLVEEGVLTQQKKGFIVNSDTKLEIQPPHLLLYKERLEALVIDTQIFGMSEEMVEQMKQEIEATLKKDDEK
ncbi:GntR family transcriptional regulator [Isobaculum melis]|uniref:Transcriptional regulator, GntR family n=1 Tax=Isobaculum melis TaxID=142588 RepID=A0A1H9TWB0_9LACT|nr:GntR family transcriptional regulator [Isobaculum melis]SES01197.1 transcriptional regulator, GntR family [Isobaculum melis]